MEGKKVLTMLLGSPRAGGNSETMADALAKGAEEKGYEIRKVRLTAMTLRGCVDCRKCWSSGKPCVQNDDMDRVYSDIEDASVIAFVSPLYFYSWSAQIKPVWDRLLPYGADDAPRSLKDKKALLLVTAGDADENCFDGLKASFGHAVGYMNWQVAGMVCAPGIYGKGEMEAKGIEYLRLAGELGGSL